MLVCPLFKDTERTNTVRVLCLIFLVFLGIQVTLTAQHDGPTRVLFVGNSYTYFWNLPQQVRTMAEDADIDIITRQSTIGGSNLGQHWRGDRNLKSVDLIKTGNFDIVVLQDHSMRAIQHPDSLLYFGKLFGDLIREHGGEPYLYMTWSREFDPYMQEQVSATYRQLAEEIGAELVPVGEGWMKARGLRPDLSLYDQDQSHPSPLGSYLTACIFFGKLTGQSPVGLPERLVSTDGDGEKLYLNIQSPQDALFCQKVARDILSRERN